MRKIPKPRNPHALALRSGLFNKKVVPLKKQYNRKKVKNKLIVE